MIKVEENGKFDRVYWDDGMGNLENKKNLSCKIKCFLSNGFIFEAFRKILKTHTTTF